MCEPNQGWWDRDTDHEGRRIRSDVRSAAREIWQRVRSQVESVLGESGAAGELMELSVAQASNYLDRKGVPVDSQSHVGLLLIVFWRLLERRRAALSRLEPIGGIGELSDRVSDDWSTQIDSRLDAEKIVRLLSEQSRTILALRSAGYEWADIAKLMNSPLATVKRSFWREIRQIREKLQ
jgi:hypothetical protein